MTVETLITEGQNTQAADQQTAEDSTPNEETQTGEESEVNQQPDQGEKTDDGEKNTDGEQGESEDETGDKSEDRTGAPDEYEFNTPDDTQLDDAVVDAFSEVAKDLNMPQDAAQKMIDKVTPVIQARQAEQIAAVREEWAETAKVDKEFGGDKLKENLATAAKAIDTFGTPELKALLNESGLGNHPEVIRAFYRAGKTISQDTFVGGDGETSGETSAAQRMYPGMNP